MSAETGPQLRELPYLNMCRQLAEKGTSMNAWEREFVANVAVVIEKCGVLTGAQRAKLQQIYEERL